MINLKKIYFFFFLIIINYFLFTAIIFSFSYISLINGKTYNWFWVKSIQKKIYFDGLRNIWQFNKNCATFDKDLLYKPIIGQCSFNNPEFQTELNFKKYNRSHGNKVNFNKGDIVILGDSIAMGWGVNDNETFSYHLEKGLKKNVYNLAVSSYGTVREIKRYKLSPFFDNSDTLIIQYHPNDLGENKELNINKSYLSTDFEKFFQHSHKNKLILILGTFKSSLRLFFSDIIDIAFKEKNMEIIDFNEHRIYLEKILRANINLKKKRLIVFLAINPWQKIINFPQEKNEIEYLLIQLKKEDYFTIDDHPNAKGHKQLSDYLTKYLISNRNK